MGATLNPTQPAQSATLWTSADLLARAKFYARRPVPDESMTDAQWYALLTEANAEWVAKIATVAPDVLYAQQGPTLLTTADGGYSYTFGVDADGNQITPLGDFELREYPTGRPWIEGTEWDLSSDFVNEGWRIRFPGQVSRSYGNGPWARFIPAGGTISATVQPWLQPPMMNMLLVFNACARFARRGGVMDPSPFEQLEAKEWWGDPARGMNGWCASLMTRALTQGGTAIPAYAGRWWTGVDTGAGYSKYQG